MNFYLLCDQRNLEVHGHTRLREEAPSMGINLEFFVPERFELVIGEKDTGLFYDELPLSLPDVFIARYFTETYYSQMICQYFEGYNQTFAPNKMKARLAANDKLTTLYLLSRHDIPVPKSILAKLPLSLDFIDQHLEYPIVVKKIVGSQGRGIILSRDKGQLEDLMEMLHGEVDTNRFNLILQEYIAEQKGQDIRVLVIGGRVIGAILRRGKSGSFKANYSSGGEALPFEINKEVEALALKSTRILGLDIAGVDILFDKEGGYKVCEVNASPGFKGFEEATGMNVAREILNFYKEEGCKNG